MMHWSSSLFVLHAMRSGGSCNMPVEDDDAGICVVGCGGVTIIPGSIVRRA